MFIENVQPLQLTKELRIKELQSFVQWQDCFPWRGQLCFPITLTQKWGMTCIQQIKVLEIEMPIKFLYQFVTEMLFLKSTINLLPKQLFKWFNNCYRFLITGPCTNYVGRVKRSAVRLCDLRPVLARTSYFKLASSSRFMHLAVPAASMKD